MVKPTAKSATPGPAEVLIDISTALIRVDDETVQCRVICDADGAADRLPFGAFLPDQHRTMEIALRQLVLQQIGVELGHVEQLYTFADQGRNAPGQADAQHIVSVGYLALTNQRSAGDWRNLYDYFPWEDGRDREVDPVQAEILPPLQRWLKTQNPAANERAHRAFGMAGHTWDEEQALERYELLYEAGLVPEAWSDGRAARPPEPALPGQALQLDHRRILATALGRLRGKLKYRPVVFDLMPAQFTLTALQTTTEAVIGQHLHKQNFRRLVEKSGLVVATGQQEKSRGRPAELFRFAHGEPAERPLAGLRVQARRNSAKR